MKFVIINTTIVFFLLKSSLTFSQARLPQIVRDSMILQRDTKATIWGWAAVNEKVNVKFNGKTYKTKAGADGKWSVIFPPTKAGGPYTIDITASNKITLKEILFGDVWFCSGQSNMVHQMNIHDVTYAKDIAEANYPQIRQFWIPTLTNLQTPQNDLPTGYWKSAVGEDVRPFSAVAYFFARKIYEKYRVPIGIINASVGGTPIEAWTSEEGLKEFSSVINTIQKNKDTAYVNQTNRAAAAGIKANPSKDLGMMSEKKWFDVSYVPKNWHIINIPGYWEDQGIKELNGVVWYRREIDVPASMIGKPASVFLGRIVDADVLYINGKQVGSTAYQYPQRRYNVPADVLKAGKNIFVIRVTNTGGKGGFVPDKPYCLFAGKDSIDLKGYWQYKVGEVFEPVNNRNAVTGINATHQPTALFNAMVAPVINYNIKGILWYQGESNAGRPDEYAKLLPALIHDWRSKWKQGELPFFYVQLPGFMDYNYLPSESKWAVLREAQLKALSVSNTAMAVAIDLGEWNDVHPDNKKDVGERLALAAKKIVYKEDIVYSGPIYQSFKKEGNKIIITFDHIGSGLIFKDSSLISPPSGELEGAFAIAGADKKFVWAKVKIEGDKIIVWSDDLTDPLYVRYAWADNPVNPNLYNKEGLPASPFRTDTPTP
ncbi:sialate O-acetylesterase [Terrimonas pollutisoli]|uniref:sialate O-acetylesterase n=1 Tax=Terrimonas pollutisoli TaxID=3034147 RepID=UPI0023EDF711|nr:sialate O-acetylesterase [Terrimonas sp. H1YJ31]